MNRAVSTDSPARQLAAFVAKPDPKAAKLVRAGRSALRKKFPTAIEQVYDNPHCMSTFLDRHRQSGVDSSGSLGKL